MISYNTTYFEQDLFCLLGQEQKYAYLLRGNDFFRNSGLEQLLNHCALRLNTDSHQVVGSYFTRRYIKFCAAFLYQMSHHNRVFDYSFSNIAIQYEGKEMLFQLKEFDKLMTRSPEQSRAEWRTLAVKRLFTDNIDKVWRIIRDYTGIDESTQWSFTASIIFELYDQWLQNTETPLAWNRMLDDLNYLKQEFSPMHIGRKRLNPIKVELCLLPSSLYSHRIVGISHTIL